MSGVALLPEICLPPLGPPIPPSPSFPPSLPPSLPPQYSGVNTAEGLKSGAVLYRLTGSAFAVQSTYDRMFLLDTYHGAPSGVIFADETMADSMPSHGSELCLVVESMLSFNVIHEILGDASFAERAEVAAYNALPGTWTADMWAHQYLQQANAIDATHHDDHIWLADGPDATTFGRGPNYPCCTSNGPQGWPRFVTRMVHASPDGGLALSLLGPVSATVGPVTLNVSTLYPFGDDLDITLAGTPSGFPFYVRIPSWATAATLTVDGGAAQSVGTSNGTMHRVTFAAGGTHTLHLALNPDIRYDSVGVLYNGAIAVRRGALLYGLTLDEQYNVTNTYNTSDPNHPTCEDFEILQTTSTWNVALVFDPTDPAGPSKYFTFAQAGGPNATYPFDHSAPPLSITAQVREVNSWGIQTNAAAPPPNSPACSAAGACGTPFTATLYPYGMTHIRMSVLPWTPQ